jgi:hypothetical protein
VLDGWGQTERRSIHALQYRRAVEYEEQDDGVQGSLKIMEEVLAALE